MGFMADRVSIYSDTYNDWNSYVVYRSSKPLGNERPFN